MTNTVESRAKRVASALEVKASACRAPSPTLNTARTVGIEEREEEEIKRSRVAAPHNPRPCTTPSLENLIFFVGVIGQWASINIPEETILKLEIYTEGLSTYNTFFVLLFKSAKNFL
jgi:hypothetical protein